MQFGKADVGSNYPPDPPHDQSAHAKDDIVPRTVVIERGGTVTFDIPAAVHQIGIYAPGTEPAACFTREISPVGIGLLHNVALTPGEVELSIPSRRGYSIRVRTRILWCHSCGEGWYISGGLFVGTAFVDG